MQRSTLYVLVLLLFFSACKKPKPIEKSGNPVFYIDAVIDGSKLELKAGDNGYYMRPSFYDDTIGIRSFVGKLGKINCINQEVCPESFEVIFREKDKGLNGGQPSIDENITLKSYNFRGPASHLFQSYKATFFSKSTPLGTAHLWDFDDGATSTQVNPIHYYLNEADSLVEPKLTVQSSGCNNSISYPVNFNKGCLVDFFPSKVGVNLNWNAAPKQNRAELWDLGNGYLPLGAGNPIPSDSVFIACVKSTNVITGCTTYKCKNIVIDTGLVGCVANFDMIKEKVMIKDVRDFSEVTVKWRDSAGKLYNSDLYAQPVSSVFDVISVEDYIDDVDGNPTKKVTVTMKVRLYGDSQNDYLEFETEKSILAVSYSKI
jgi:PKD repeat protein